KKIDLKYKLLRIEYQRVREVWQTVDPLVFKAVIEHGSPHLHLINPNNGQDLNSPHLTRPGDEVIL
ncbi:MAG: hypothetical protein KJO26_15735, partial [Deltaproteobacteria bacterium]|nr:hypothetical protein [Deltaproteobacteria bacterium]